MLPHVCREVQDGALRASGDPSRLRRCVYLRARAQVTDQDVKDQKAMEIETLRGSMKDISPQKLYNAIRSAQLTRSADARGPLAASETNREPSESRAGWAALFRNHGRHQNQKTFD